MRKFLPLILCLAIGGVLPSPMQAAPTTAPSVGAANSSSLEQQSISIAPKCVACTVGLVSINIVGNRVGIETGSGVIVSADGLILTAGHVITAPGNKLTVRFTDGRVVKAVAVGLDHLADTGLARITDPAPADGWDFCEMAADKSAAPGDWVLATGNPGSIVVGRNPPVRLGRVTGHDAQIVATNCALEPGDSGGPVFDLTGKVVGINSRIVAGNGARRLREYISLHVPVSLFHSQWKELLEGVNANPDVNLGNEYVRPKPVPGISAASRAALNKLAADKDTEALKLLADEKKTGSIKPTPAMVERLMKVAARLDREHAATQPSTIANRSTTAPSNSTRARRRSTGNPMADLNALAFSPEWMNAGKTSRQTLSIFLPALQQAGRCMVEIRDGNQPVLLGTIVSSDGLILTKASDLPHDPKVLLPDKKVVSAKLIGIDTTTDLALLKVIATDLPAAQFTDSATLGEWIEAPTATADQPAVGVVSLAARPIPRTFAHFEGEQRIVLGVGFGGPGPGTIITEVAPGMPAQASGMKVGDEVFQLNGNPINNHDDFISKLGKAKPGDRLSIMVHRAGKDLELNPVIGQARSTTQTSNGIGEADNYAAGQLSTRRTNFPQAIQTDVAVWADECGGPLINLRGQVIGVTIARYDRVCTFALPAELVQVTVKKLMAEDVHH